MHFALAAYQPATAKKSTPRPASVTAGVALERLKMETAVVEAQKFAVHQKTGKPYVVAFGKNQFYVPEEAVRSYPKKANKDPKLQDGKALGAALATKAPEKWMQWCNPETLMHISGVSGDSCLYTTFSIPGHPEEERFLHHVSGPIAEKNFEDWREAMIKSIQEGKLPKREEWNERLERRYAVLDWTKKNDCPERNQLHPEINKWVSVAKHGDELVKSCRVAPETKRRPKGPNDKRSGAQLKSSIHKDHHHNTARGDPLQNVLWAEALQLGPEGSYNIFKNKVDGKLYITQYKYEAGDRDSAGPAYENANLDEDPPDNEEGEEGDDEDDR